MLQAAKGDPQGFYDQMMRTNPQFAAFMRDNQGRSPQEIAQRYGIDLGAMQGFM